MDDATHCPKCGASWLGERIADVYKRSRDDGTAMWQGMSDRQIENLVKKNYSPPYHFMRQIGIEYEENHPEYYDGISEYECPDCLAHFGRWTGREIPPGHCESRFGARGVVPVR